MTVAYLDSSAIVKLAVPEAESPALARHVDQLETRITSALSRTEVTRAAARYSLEERARETLGDHRQLRINDDVIDLAARLEPTALRSLDAIHLASALIFNDELDEFITYDERLAEAARQHGLNVVSPA